MIHWNGIIFHSVHILENDNNVLGVLLVYTISETIYHLSDPALSWRAPPVYSLVL